MEETAGRRFADPIGREPVPEKATSPPKSNRPLEKAPEKQPAAEDHSASAEHGRTTRKPPATHSM